MRVIAGGAMGPGESLGPGDALHPATAGAGGLDGVHASEPILPGSALHESPVHVIEARGQARIGIDEATLLHGDYSRAGPDLVIQSPDGHQTLITGYFAGSGPAALVSPDGAMLMGHTVSLLAGPASPGQYAQAAATGAGNSIGEVASLQGGATVQHADGTTEDLAGGSPIFEDDVISTGDGAKMSIKFVDGTALTMSANARMVMDELVYDPAGNDNSMVLNLVQGSFVFVTGLVAKTGTVRADTPVATMGIRGTTPTVTIDATSATTFGIAPDPDGTVGTYQIINLVTGQVIGTVSSPDFIYRLASVDGLLEQFQVDPAIADEINQLLQDTYNTFGPPGGPNNDPNDGQDGGTPGQGGQNDDPNLGGDDTDFANLEIEGLGGGTEGGEAEPIVIVNNDALPAVSSTTSATAPTETVEPPTPFEFNGPNLNLVEDGQATIDGFNISYPAPVSVEIVAGSTVTLNSTDGLTSVSGNGTNNVKITGPASAVNNALNGATYNPTPDSESGTLDFFFVDPATTKVLAFVDVPVSITPVNDPPVAVDDNPSVEEDDSVIINVLANDTDVDNVLTAASITQFTQAANGTVVSNGNGTFTYTPNANYNGPDSFTYTISDGEFSSTATVDITVDAVNDPATISVNGEQDISVTEAGGIANGTAGDPSASGELNVADADDGETQFQPLAPAALVGTYGDFTFDAATGAWSYTLDNDRAATQALNQGDNVTDTLTVTSLDGTESHDITIDIAGANDPATISVNGEQDISVTEAGGIANGTAGDPSASGELNVADVDDGETQFQVPASLAGTYGDFTFDAATGAWSYTLDNDRAATQALNQGDNVTDTLTVTSLDGTDNETITVNVAGANDAPVITGGDTTGTVAEDGTTTATGTLAATDPDGAAQLAWTLAGADFAFNLDSLNITKNGNLVFSDDFDDNAAPPDGPNGPNSYILPNGVEIHEGGGYAILSGAYGQSTAAPGSGDPFTTVNAVVRTNIDPANMDAGLKSDDDFTVEGVFDLTLPDVNREAFGIRLRDRLVGGDGTVPDQPGDDVIELIVVRDTNGVLRVQLREKDFVADNVTIIDGMELNPPEGADQILLRLDHSAEDPGTVLASFDFLSDGEVIASHGFEGVGQIFGTETEALSDDEVWTRAEVIAWSPDAAATVLTGAYGTLSFDQNGNWTYDLDNDSPQVQALGANDSVTDSFEVVVTDEHGASATETVNVTVNGANDLPVVNDDVANDIPEDAGRDGVPAYETNVFADSGFGADYDVDAGDTPVITRFRVDDNDDGFVDDLDTWVAVDPVLGGTHFSDSIENPDGGYVTVHADGTIQIAPGTDYDYLAEGENEFLGSLEYEVTSGGDTATGIATGYVTGANDLPVFTSGMQSVEETFNLGPDSQRSAVGDAYLVAGNSLINGLGGDAGFGENTFAANDDGSTTISAEAITAVFGEQGLNFFGTNYSTIYINNNGNITFGSPYSNYTPNQITAGLGNPIIAPFWADVDTRGGGVTPTPGGNSAGSNLVHYDLDTANGVLTITWDDVGYFSARTNPLNAFQLQLIDVGNGDFDIVFRYEDINWTTGDASGGSGGLGGAPARAGYANNLGVSFELPQSGNQDQMLALESTEGNTGIPGVYVFNVRSGEVVDETVSASGQVTFDDADLTDSHTIASVVFLGDGTPLGTLEVVEGSDTTGTGTGGVLDWDYSALSSDFDDLSVGEELVEAFDVTIVDEEGATATVKVTATITKGEEMLFLQVDTIPVINLEGMPGPETFALAPETLTNALDFSLDEDSLDISALLQAAFDTDNPNGFVTIDPWPDEVGGFTGADVYVDPDGPDGPAGNMHVASLTFDEPAEAVVLNVVFGEGGTAAVTPTLDIN